MRRRLLLPHLLLISAFIKAVHPEDVSRAHLSGSPNGHIGVREGNNGWLSVPREGKPSIVHDRVVVIGSAQVPCLDLPEIGFHPRDDVLQQDANMLVPIRAGLFMVEAQGVKQLMLNNIVENTALTTQRHDLAPATTPNK